MKSCVLLLSGGIDSVIAVNILLKKGYTVYPLFIDYGQKAAKNEKKAASFFCKFYNLPLLKTVSVNEYKSFFNHPLLRNKFFKSIENSTNSYSKNYLPFRNLLFGCIAAIYCAEVDINSFALGFTKKVSYKQFPDTSPEFLNYLNSLIKIVSPDIRIKAFSPIIIYTKAELLKIAVADGIPITESYSCYNEQVCYKCESCLEVKKAYTSAEVFNHKGLI